MSARVPRVRLLYSLASATQRRRTGPEPQVPDFRFRGDPEATLRLMAASAKENFGVEEAASEGEPRVLEPGAAPFGNFPHYSRFHPPEQRLRLLPPELLRRLFPQGPQTKPILGLDVGCNSGVSDGRGISDQAAKQLAASMCTGVLAWAWHHSFPKMSLKA